MRNLGIRSPLVNSCKYKTFSQALFTKYFLESINKTKPSTRYPNIYSPRLRKNKANVEWLNQHLFIPLFSKLSNTNHYDIKYFLYNTSNKRNLSYIDIQTPQFFDSYQKALEYKQLYIKNTNSNISEAQILIKCRTKIISDLDGFYNENQPSDITWRQSFNGVRRALRYLQTEESMVLEYARWTSVEGSILVKLLDYPLALTSGFFKKIKSIVHANIDNLPPELRYFIDLGLLNGYPPLKIREMTDDPQRWLSIDDDSQYDRKWWFEQFRRTFALAGVTVPLNIMSLKQFALSRWLWVTDGATKFSKMTLNGDLIKTKLGAAASLSDEEILNLVYNSTKINKLDNLIGVFIKPDEKYEKRRLIANLPLGIYIVFYYFRYVLNQYTGLNPYYMKLSPELDEMIDVLRLIREKKIFYPLDESAYDYHVTSNSWNGFFDFLDTVIPDQDALRLAKGYFGHAIWQFEGKTGTWISGMPSGLALTSYLNSWINFIKQETMLKGYINWAAGDDVLAVPYNQNITLEQIERHYRQFGSVAHALKNWKSHRYAEYLKTFYSSAGMTGYPARVFSSILWAGTDRFFLPSDRLPELFELFKQFFDRVGIPMPERYVAADLARSVSNKVPNFTSKVAIEWMHSPKVHGGAGKIPYNDKTFTWQISDKQVLNYENIRIRMPRVIKYFGKIDLYIGRYTLTTSRYKLGRTYTLPPINNIQEWEARLNREDIDYHGPFSSLILDTIPLPTVDFISTSQMSKFAEKHYFNSFPNLRGSWNNIASKLVNASLALVETITEFVYTNHVEVLQ